MANKADKPQQSYLRRHWKMILNVITILALGGLIFAIRDQLAETLRNLDNVNLWILLLIIPVEIWNYDAQARLYRRLFRVVGNEFSYKFLFRASLELNFVNHVFPSGGVTGISYFGLRMKQGRELTASKATLVQVMKLMLTFVSFEAVLIAGLFFLAVMGKASGLTLFVTGSLSMLLIIGTLVFAYIIGSKQRIDSFFTGATKLINKLIQLVRPRHPETISIASARESFDDMHQNYLLFRSRLKELKAPLWYAFIMNVTEIAALYVVYAAFGEYVNVGAVILAYAVANFAGLISVLPGGVGVYEGLMIGVLAVSGVSPAISSPVTLMYRVINTVIQLPPGYYFYHKTLKEKAADG